jgi:hypothetical protein
MPEEPEFRIRVSTVGADDAASSIHDVESAMSDAGGAADDAAPKFGKMAEEAGGMRESKLLARDLFEMMRGGDASIAGLSGILRYALISSEALSATGPIGIAIASLTASLISVWATHAAQSSDAKDKVKGDLDEEGKAAEDFADRYVKALKTIYDKQQVIAKGDKDDLATLAQKGKQTEAQARLDEQAATDLARAKYLLLSQNATPEQRAQYKKDFEATEKDIKDRTTENTAAAAVQQTADTLSATAKSLADTQAALAQDKQKLADAANLSNAARDFLAQQGITPTLDDKGAVTGFTQKGDAKEGLDGKTTAPTIDAIAPLQAKIDELQKRVDLFTGMIQQGGTAGDDNTLPINYTPADMAELRKNLDDSEGQLASFSTLLNQIKQAGQNLPVYGKVAPDANKGIADQEKTLSEQQAKIAQLKVELDQKQQPLENARIETSQNRQEQSLDADTTNQKAAEKTHEDVAKHMRDLTIAQDRAALEADKKLSEDGKKAGSDAETDIRLLGGSKAQIEAAHIAVQELSQGHAEGAAQLEDILNNLVWSTQSLTANQKDYFEGIIEKLQQVADNLNDHNAQIQNLKRPSL